MEPSQFSGYMVYAAVWQPGRNTEYKSKAPHSFIATTILDRTYTTTAVAYREGMWQPG